MKSFKINYSYYFLVVVPYSHNREYFLSIQMNIVNPAYVGVDDKTIISEWNTKPMDRN
jgi:hypothetical protein